MEISDKVLTAAGLKPSDEDPEVADVSDVAEEFTDADAAPIDLG